MKKHILVWNISNTGHDSRSNLKVCIGYFRNCNLQFLNHQKGIWRVILLWLWFLFFFLIDIVCCDFDFTVPMRVWDWHFYIVISIFTCHVYVHNTHYITSNDILKDKIKALTIKSLIYHPARLKPSNWQVLRWLKSYLQPSMVTPSVMHITMNH